MTTKWQYTAEQVEFCNCNYACGCNIHGFPTSADGSCQGILGLRINEGHCGDINLAGATLVAAFAWPKAIHDGGGSLALFFDPATTEDQRNAVSAIMTNQYGGLPWEILATVVSDIVGTFVEPIDLHLDGTRSRVRVGDKLWAGMSPHVNPVDPSMEQEVHFVLPGGFIWNEARVGKGTGFRWGIDGFGSSAREGHWAAVAMLNHHN